MLQELSRRFGIELVEGYAMPEHIHMCLSIPPKFSVANTIGKLKDTSAIMVAQRFGRKRNFSGMNFWSRGYCVSTVGLDEEV